MLMALLSYRYVWMLICTENAYHANTRQHKQEGALQIQEMAPITCVVWHFALCGEWILEVSPTIQEVAPTTCVVWHFAPCVT